MSQTDGYMLQSIFVRYARAPPELFFAHIVLGNQWIDPRLRLFLLFVPSLRYCSRS